MTRTLAVRKPRMAEVRKLYQLLEESDDHRLQQRVEAILLYSYGFNAIEIGTELEVHPNSVYSYLHAFDQEGIDSLHGALRGGAPVRISEDKVAAIWRLAEIKPYELGLSYGRWSLSNLAEYLVKVRIVKAISREHLRRLLKKKV